MDEDLEHIKVETGLDTVQPANIGVYHYRVSNQAAVLSTCSVVVQGGHRVSVYINMNIKIVFHFSFNCDRNYKICKEDL